jgi:hypothetical protein
MHSSTMNYSSSVHHVQSSNDQGFNLAFSVKHKILSSMNVAHLHNSFHFTDSRCFIHKQIVGG